MDLIVIGIALFFVVALFLRGFVRIVRHFLKRMGILP